MSGWVNGWMSKNETKNFGCWVLNFGLQEEERSWKRVFNDKGRGMVQGLRFGIKGRLKFKGQRNYELGNQNPDVKPGLRSRLTMPHDFLFYGVVEGSVAAYYG